MSEEGKKPATWPKEKRTGNKEGSDSGHQKSNRSERYMDVALKGHRVKGEKNANRIGAINVTRPAGWEGQAREPPNPDRVGRPKKSQLKKELVPVRIRGIPTTQGSKSSTECVINLQALRKDDAVREKTAENTWGLATKGVKTQKRQTRTKESRF